MTLMANHASTRTTQLYDRRAEEAKDWRPATSNSSAAKFLPGHR